MTGLLYYTPYKGDKVSLWTGSYWQVVEFSEFSQSFSMAANSVYDVFLYVVTGAAFMELSNAWTNNTTRSQALAYRNGILVKSADHTRRYVGTIRTQADGFTRDAKTHRFVWNYYNQIWRPLYKADNTTHQYNSTTARPWNNDTNNRIEFVQGVDQMMRFGIAGQLRSSAGGNAALQYLGLDSTTVGSSDGELGGYLGNYTGPTYIIASSNGSKYMTAGYHFVQAIQWSNATASNFYASVLISGDILC